MVNIDYILEKVIPDIDMILKSHKLSKLEAKLALRTLVDRIIVDQASGKSPAEEENDD